jgi:hypothetical protein
MRAATRPPLWAVWLVVLKYLLTGSSPFALLVRRALATMGGSVLAGNESDWEGRPLVDRALRTLGVIALLATTAEFLVLRSAPAFLIDPSPVEVAVPAMLATTAFCLCFASGVVALVATGQRRQRGWLILFAALTLLAVYARYAFILNRDLEDAIYRQGGDTGYLWIEIFIDVLVPLPVPLAVLLYARPRRSKAVDADLLVERLRTPDKTEK